MIKVNLIQRKIYRLPIFMGVDLNELNFKLIFIFYIFSLTPQFILEYTKKNSLAEIDQSLSTVIEEEKKLARRVKGEGQLGEKLKAYKEKEVELKNRSKQVEQIVKLKVNPKDLFEKLARSVTRDLWFLSLKIDSEKKIEVKGGSTSYRSIGEFASRLNATPYFGGKLEVSNDGTDTFTVNGKKISYEKFILSGPIQTFNPFGE